MLKSIYFYKKETLIRYQAIDVVSMVVQIE